MQIYAGEAHMLLASSFKNGMLLTLSFFVSQKDLFRIYNKQLEMYMLNVISLSWKPFSSGVISCSVHLPPQIK